ncbi:hypothetical protein GOV04_01425 [Candidatus Woesearchaeota archaeon]|nr:hypothetical protein [Candidatus Woesearchaeota archaeon]
MPNAVTHVIIAIVLVDLYRHYIANNRFGTNYIFLAGIAGLLPDIDIVLGGFQKLFTGKTFFFHGGFTHIIALPLIILTVAIFFSVWEEKKIALALYIIAFGWTLHIALDCLILGAYAPLFPFYSGQICPGLFTNELMPALDAIILLAWLGHEQVKHKIKDYF